MKTHSGKSSSAGGYTLLEALVALGIFLAVAVPLCAVAFRNSEIAHARNRFTATCLLEQECAALRADPAAWMPSRQCTVDSTRWTILCEAAGEQLRLFRISARTSGTKYGEVVEMVNVRAAAGGIP